jgi:hypothetical protein
MLKVEREKEEQAHMSILVKFMDIVILKKREENSNEGGIKRRTIHKEINSSVN